MDAVKGVLFHVFVVGFFLTNELMPVTTKLVLPSGRNKNLRSKPIFMPLLQPQMPGEGSFFDNNILRRALIYYIGPNSVLNLNNNSKLSQRNKPIQLQNMPKKMRAKNWLQINKKPVLPLKKIRSELPRKNEQTQKYNKPLLLQVQKSFQSANKDFSPVSLFDKNGMLYLAHMNKDVAKNKHGALVKALSELPKKESQKKDDKMNTVFRFSDLVV